MTEDEANAIRASAAIFATLANAPGVTADYIVDETTIAPGVIVVSFDYLPGRYRLTLSVDEPVDTEPL